MPLQHLTLKSSYCRSIATSFTHSCGALSTVCGERCSEGIVRAQPHLLRLGQKILKPRKRSPNSPISGLRGTTTSTRIMPSARNTGRSSRVSMDINADGGPFGWQEGSAAIDIPGTAGNESSSIGIYDEVCVCARYFLGDAIETRVMVYAAVRAGIRWRTSNLCIVMTRQAWMRIRLRCCFCWEEQPFFLNISAEVVFVTQSLQTLYPQMKYLIPSRFSYPLL